jgi:glycosyltransferase involved in cell wall biosynthesis
MKLAFLLSPKLVSIPINPSNIWDDPRGLTGSEITCFKYAIELSKRKHDIFIFSKFTDTGNFGGISYFQYEDWITEFHNHQWDGLYASMATDPLMISHPDCFRFFHQQVSDFGLCESGWESHVDILAPLSHLHAHFMSNLTKFDRDNWRILYNGVDAQEFRPTEKIPGKMIWASSHDRGLHLLLEIFPQIKKRVPDASLHVFYNFSGIERFASIEHVDMSTESGKRFAELAYRSRYILEAIRRLDGKGVFVHKSVSRNKIKEEMANSEILAYPCDPVYFTETFGVVVLEACASGTVPVLCLADAFKELWSSIGYNVPSPFRDHKDDYTEKLIHILSNKDDWVYKSSECMKYAEKFYWWKLAIGLEKCFETQGREGLPNVRWDQ